MFLSLLTLDISFSRTLVVLLAIGVIASLDIAERMRHRNQHLLFGVILGTLLSVGLIKFAHVLLSPDIEQNPHIMALGVFLMFVAWRLLFGPWNASAKATVLGTFLFWVTLHLLATETDAERTAHLLAVVVALIPALVWSALFLEYHRERISTVFMMFFAGMASTVPILFYDALQRHGVILQFFFFRIVPESFNETSQIFVNNQFPTISSFQTTLVIMLVSFLLVGLIEEGSKYWVLRRAGEQFFTSVDDVMQLAIIVAIGFAFAENVTNTGYFLNFVQEYLVAPAERDWLGFFGNVAGRAVLTSMVHIVSTGVSGYFLGLATFATPFLEEAQAQGRSYHFVEYVHRLFGFQKKSVFQWQMLLSGLTFATVLHAGSNFMVTLPDALPGNPHTLGDVLGSSPGSPLHYISLLLFPCLFYVVGGFWLLTVLFHKKQNMKERGHLVMTDTFVRSEGEE